LRLRKDDPVAVAWVEAIQIGDLESLTRLLRDQPGLAAARIEGGTGGWRTPLHVAADWPGYFPNGPAVIAALIEAGADPNAPVEGSLALRSSSTPARHQLRTTFRRRSTRPAPAASAGWRSIFLLAVRT
jgi:uncharacterized protein